MNISIESMHGALEWFLVIFLAAAGFAVERWVPFRKPRYLCYVVLLITVLILDLNRVSFRSDGLNLLLYMLILLAVTEFFWVCRKRSKLLLAGAFAVLVPVFLYVFAASLTILPLPCHVAATESELIGKYDGCPAGTYVLTRRLSFDIFSPARVYVLSRDIRRTPLRKQVDKFPAPKGYIEAEFVPKWECKEDGKGKVHLFINGYTLWSLEEKHK